jgi:hypothetical protein
MGHGIELRKIDAAQGQPSASPGPAGIEPKDFAGFGYLLGEPEPGRRSEWGDNLAATRQVFSKLVRALPGDTYHSWSEALDLPAPRKGKAAKNENPRIPSGYTYLLQFIAHDMLQTTTPFWAAADLGVYSENCRGAGLVLNTLYGGGPIACPAAFEVSNSLDENRFLLRLGRVAPAQGACPMRDLARVNVASGFASTGGDSINFDRAYHANVADARNDDGIILTQLTVLFARAHNIIARNVKPGKPEAQFAYARAAMLLIYHAIIRGDLLPKILHPYVRKRIEKRLSGSSGQWLWKRKEGVPLEFSHGALRVGHAMVRTGYSLNDALHRAPTILEIVNHNQPPAGGTQRTPLEAAWVLQWSYFFDLGSPRPPNFSLRIGPSRSSLDLPALFPIQGQSLPSGYATFRDLLSAATAKMSTVDALIDNLSKRCDSLVPPKWLLADRDRRRCVIARWFDAEATHAALAPDEIARLSDDTPLPLFVLLEAGLDPDVQGQSMGVLGSIIVAEVLGGRLAEESERLQAMKPACESALPAAMWKRIIGINSMPALVDFVADFDGLRGPTQPPFI